MIKQISISGFRGFSNKQIINFALPNGKEGSGLTTIIGSNNSGKTTIIESIKAFNIKQLQNTPSFSEQMRNNKTYNKVELSMIDYNDNSYSINSVPQGGSETSINEIPKQLTYIVPSRRGIQHKFSKEELVKDQYIQLYQKLETTRNSEIKSFASRLFAINKNKTEFDILLKRVLGKSFDWCVELDGSNYYVKYINNGLSHSGDGIGDGIWSVFVICAGLFDLKDDETLVIDEPELSLHPALQEKLLELLLNQSSKKQIIISTHSPRFISWESFINGGNIIRTCKQKTDISINELPNSFRDKMVGRINSINTPHCLGLEAKEALFLEDNVIITEGQEDVIIYKRIAKDLGIEITGSFFGWGAGGAPNIEFYADLFKSIGYKKIVCIFDGDKHKEYEKCKQKHPNFLIEIISKDDVRDKDKSDVIIKEGLATTKGILKEENKLEVIGLFNRINNYMIDD